MTISPLRILALLAVATWCGGSPAWGQYHAPQQFAPQSADGGVVPAAYYQGGMMGGQMMGGGMMGGTPMQTMVYDQGTAYQQGGYYGEQGSGGYGQPVETGYQQPGYQGDVFDQVGDQLENFGAIEGQPPCYAACPCYGYTRAEVYFLNRDIRSNIPFTSQRVGGPIVLQTRDLDLQYEPGIRGIVGVPLSDCLAVEASYFGQHDWFDSATATDPAGNLFSVYSDFGRGTGFIFAGRPIFDFTEGSTSQSISYRSEIHNADLNVLGRYCLKNPKQELWLFAGTRYIRIDEDFSFFTLAQTMDPVLGIRSSLSTVDTENNMVGFQLGGVLNHFVTKRVRFSFDSRVAVLANFSEVNNVVATNLFTLGRERLRDESVAFAGDMGVEMSWDVTCWLSVTGGYRVVYIDGATLAARNFNTVLPGNGLRVPFLDSEGSIVMQGATAGLEVRW